MDGGPGDSLRFLPEAHTDFPLFVSFESWGLWLALLALAITASWFVLSRKRGRKTG